MQVCEIFHSVSGEGCNIGTPMIFIRLSGCSMQCDFCDTRQSWQSGGVVDVITEQQILDRMVGFKTKNVCITGGEPTEQDLTLLCRLLRDKKYKIHLETNGYKFNWDLTGDFQWITVSPKMKGHDCRWDDYAHEFKFVVSEKTDLHVLETIVCRIPKSTPIFLQPCNNSIVQAKRIYNFCLDHPRFRAGIQLHKIINVR